MTRDIPGSMEKSDIERVKEKEEMCEEEAERHKPVVL